jgi:hypothetical protein
MVAVRGQASAWPSLYQFLLGFLTPRTAATQSVRKIQVVAPVLEKWSFIMKKIVPDPPRRKPITTPFFTVQSDMYPPDALAHVSELLRGVIETLDEHCRARAGESGLSMLGNAMHASEIAFALVEHVHARLYGQQAQR